MAKAYTREFKIETVKLSYQTVKQLGELASDLGISRSSLADGGKSMAKILNRLFPARGSKKSGT
jgi:transposase-like protein